MSGGGGASEVQYAEFISCYYVTCLLLIVASALFFLSLLLFIRCFWRVHGGGDGLIVVCITLVKPSKGRMAIFCWPPDCADKHTHTRAGWLE